LIIAGEPVWLGLIETTSKARGTVTGGAAEAALVLLWPIKRGGGKGEDVEYGECGKRGGEEQEGSPEVHGKPIVPHTSDAALWMIGDR
jgi:hypothetical protein